jgi:transposase
MNLNKFQASLRLIAPSLPLPLYMLSRNESYHELGANYFDEHRREHVVDRLTRRLQHLGYRVSLEPLAAAQSCIFNVDQ